MEANLSRRTAQFHTFPGRAAAVSLVATGRHWGLCILLLLSKNPWLGCEKILCCGYEGFTPLFSSSYAERGAASRNWWPRDFVLTHFQVARIQFERGLIKTGRVPKLSVERPVQSQSIGGSKFYQHRRSIETRMAHLAFS